MYSGTYRNAIDLNGFIGRDDETGTSLEHTRLDQVCTFRFYLNRDCRSFNFEFSGIDDVGDIERGLIVAPGLFKFFVEMFQRFRSGAVFSQKTFDIVLGKRNGIRIILAFLQKIVQRFVDGFYGFICTVILQRIRDQGLKRLFLGRC